MTESKICKYISIELSINNTVIWLKCFKFINIVLVKGIEC